MSIIYRKIDQKDIGNCAKTLMKAFKESPWNEEWTYEQACTRLDELMSARVSRGYVAYDTDNDVVVAMSIGRIMTYLSFKEIWVDEFSVSPDYQRMGVGSTLIDYVREELKKEEDPISYIVLTTEKGAPSVEFYEKNGIHSEERVLFMSGKVVV